MRKLSLLLVLMLLAVNIFALSEFDKHISNAKVYYDTGEFDKVINELSEALNIVKKNNQKGMIEAYKYLAFSYVAYGNVDKAKNYFVEVLKLNPDFDLDRDNTSPKILSVFDQARIDYKKIKKEEKKKEKALAAKANKKSSTNNSNQYYVPSKKKEKPREKAQPKGKTVKKKKKTYNFGYYGTSTKKAEKKSVKKSVELAKVINPAIPPRKSAPARPNNYKQPTKFNAAWRSFIIPGWGQLYKGQKAKGWVFIGTTAILDVFYILNTSAVKSAYKNYEEYRTISADYETEYWNKYNKVYGRYQLFGLIHILFWTYNMTDASFFGWKKINISMDINKKGTFMLTLKKEF